ncbi:MAG TPA: hypothetical protein PKV16_00675 [Caldisericia bacterium]|nr:hypothetical protein [Caldisericia bacterium]HPF49074.1 hypothetical protein [Caldisericia bacterium]HPI83062.1 hypothetical protein [Caldisericia bacterium]HPQ92289.1 hypothetical protein [Caldisericia bacterium]HRV74613.1 hypothetical protein [Caldisericia bacterium]
MSLSEIGLNDSFIGRIKTHIASGKLGKSYILCGSSEGVLLEFSRAFAKAIVCEESLDDFCGECHDCKMISALSHPDISIYTTDKSTIGIEIARKIQEDSSQTTYRSRRRVNIIPDAHLMTIQAQNALLKTLEDGTRNCVTLLATTNPDRILDTIHSRSITIKLPPKTAESIVDNLEKLGVSRDIVLSESEQSSDDIRWIEWFFQNREAAQSIVDVFESGDVNFADIMIQIENTNLLDGISLVLPQIIVRSYRLKSGIEIDSPLLGKSANKLAKLDDARFDAFIEEYRNIERLWTTQTRKSSLVQTTLMNLWI